MAVDLSAFARFVSAVDGHIVTRYSTLRFDSAPDMIGYSRAPIAPGDPRGAGVPVFHPEVIVAIPHAEWGRFAREYGRALRHGALRERTADEYLAFVESHAAVPAPEVEPEA